MFGYIYKVTNLINGKIYIGQHYRSDNSLTELDQNYWGSGVKFLNALNKYGKENFKREILCWCNNLEEINKMEIYYIKQFNALDPNIGYNLHEGGASGNTTAGFTEEQKIIWRQNIAEGTKKAMDTPEMHEKMSKANQKTPEWKQSLSEANKGKKLSQETKDKISQNSKEYWKNEEYKQNQINKKLDYYKDPENHKKTSEAVSKAMTPEVRQRISESCKKVKHTPEWNKHVGEARKGKKWSEEQKQKVRGIPKPKYKYKLPDGSIRLSAGRQAGKDWIKLEQVSEEDYLRWKQEQAKKK